MWVIFGETLAKKGGGAVLPDVLESQPTDSSHLLISWNKSPLKPALQTEMRTGKSAKNICKRL